jgi:hypothetical protein
MRDAGPGPCCRLVVQFRIQFEGRFHLAVGHDRVRFVALVHLHAVGVELVLLEGDRLADGVALFLGRGGPASQRASMLAWITSGSVPPVIPSASKIGPNSPIDWLARVTICLATGARSAL